MRNGLMKVAFALSAIAGTAAHAATIDFNGSSFLLDAAASAAVDEGFTVTLNPATSNSLLFPINQANLTDNGTKALFLANNGSWTLTETVASAGGFDLLGLEIRGSFAGEPNRWSDTVTFLGTKVGGGTVSATYSGLTDLFATAGIPGSFTGLSSVEFIPTINIGGGLNDFEFVVDNIEVAASVAPAVPEPSTWAMMIGGFALAGAGLRARRTRVALA